MLTRILSGAVGVLLLSVVLYFHEIALPIAVAVIVAIMLFELIRAVELEKNIPILISAELGGISIPLMYTISLHEDWFTCNCIREYHNLREQLLHEVSYVIWFFQFTILLIAAFVIFVTWLRKHNEIRYEQVFFVLAVMIIVPQAMTTMLRIDYLFSDESGGLFYLIMGLCGAWIADTGAYFSGVALGKHKLCPEISPKKTVEGLIGGILTTAIVYAAAFSIHDGFTTKTAVTAFIAGMICAVIGTVGDLSASMVKRQIGFKDYGKIMPGHGGLMDRFDSILFVLPTFYVLLIFMHLY